jgi:hypothetical protein
MEWSQQNEGVALTHVRRVDGRLGHSLYGTKMLEGRIAIDTRVCSGDNILMILWDNISSPGCYD